MKFSDIDTAAQWVRGGKKYLFFSHRFNIRIYRQLPPGSDGFFCATLAYWNYGKKIWMRIHSDSEVTRRSIQGVEASSRYVFFSSDL